MAQCFGTGDFHEMHPPDQPAPCCAAKRRPRTDTGDWCAHVQGGERPKPEQIQTLIKPYDVAAAEIGNTWAAYSSPDIAGALSLIPASWFLAESFQGASRDQKSRARDC